jgi:hypothetical protein
MEWPQGGKLNATRLGLDGLASIQAGGDALS